MKTRNTLILFGLIAFLVFLLVRLPASVAYPVVRNMINGPELYGIRGTLWDGQADSVTFDRYTLKDAHWEIRPLSLLLGRIGIDIDVLDQRYPLKASFSRGLDGSIEADTVRGILPTGILQQVPALSLVQLEGEMRLDIQRLLIKDREIRSASGEINLVDTLLQQPLQTKIGNLQLSIKEQNNQIQIDIKDRQAPIAIQAVLGLLPGHKFTIKASLKPGAAADNTLLTMLRNISRIEPDGSMHIQYQGVY